MARPPRVDDFVRLTQDVPDLFLNRGAVGVVRSVWMAPSVAFEVEFHKIGHDYQCRALLSAEQVEVADDAAEEAARAALVGQADDPALMARSGA